MDRPKTFVGHRLDIFTPTYYFLLVSIRRPFYSFHRHDSSAHGTGPLPPFHGGEGGRWVREALLLAISPCTHKITVPNSSFLFHPHSQIQMSISHPSFTKWYLSAVISFCEDTGADPGIGLGLEDTPIRP